MLDSHKLDSHKNYKNLINKLRPFFLTAEVTSPVQHIPPSMRKPTPIPKKDEPYSPREKDSLFWCFYILVNGIGNYELLKYNDSTLIKEQQEKIRYVEMTRTNPSIRKIKGISSIEEKIMEPRINYTVLEFLARMENIHILLVFPKSYYEIGENEKYNVIEKHSVEANVSKERIEQLKKGRIKRESISKLLKPLSSYKLADLQHFFQLLELKSETKLTKQLIYDMILKLE